MGSLFFFKILFIYSWERQRHRQREKQAPCSEPDSALDPRSPGSWPEPKVDTQPFLSWLTFKTFLRDMGNLEAWEKQRRKGARRCSFLHILGTPWLVTIPRYSLLNFPVPIPLLKLIWICNLPSRFLNMLTLRWGSPSKCPSTTCSWFFY